MAKKIFPYETENLGMLHQASHATKISTRFKTNSFSWLNLDEINFLFIYPIIVLLTFLNPKFFTIDRGFKSCLFFRL